MSFNSNWPVYYLRDVCTITDCLHSTAPTVNYKTPFRMLRTSNIRNGRIITDEAKYVTEETYEAWSVRGQLEKDDVILTREAPMGEVGIIKSTHERYFLGQRMLQLKADQQIILPYFLYYSLLSPSIQNQIKMHEGTGSVVSNIRIPALKKFKIQVPPIETQKAVVGVLKSIDDKIDVNNAVNKNLEEMAQALFKRWFVDFEFPNEDGEPYKTSGGEFEESELGPIPKGWKFFSLGELCDISTISINPSLRSREIFEHYSIPAFDNGKLPVFEAGSMIKSNKYRVFMDSILVSKLNPETKRIWNPYCFTENAICSTEFINYIPKSKKLRAYCISLLNSEAFHQFLLQNTTGSTNSRQRVNPNSTLNFKFAYCGDSMALYFSEIVSDIYKKISENILESKRLASIRDTLLPKLMSGEIRVPVEQEQAQVQVQAQVHSIYQPSYNDLPMAAESKADYQT